MAVLVNITVPAFNEEKILAKSINALSSFLQNGFPYPYEIVIANNGSTDGTLEIARALARQHPCIRVLHLKQAGRGGALKASWSQSRADILAYMDADLSSDLSAFSRLVEPLVQGDWDVAIGSRLLDPRRTTRCLHREVLSRGYNCLLRCVLGTHVRDAQCGFKALTRKAADSLLPLIESTNWFFDTELLVLAERAGFRTFELPLGWVENRATHVKICRTILEDLRGILRLRGRLTSGFPMSKGGALALTWRDVGGRPQKKSI